MSPEAVEVKSSFSPEELADVVFTPVVRPSAGARREGRECEIPKSVGALHQSANALILTTDLFHPAASPMPYPKHCSQDHGPLGALVPLNPARLLRDTRREGQGRGQ